MKIVEYIKAHPYITGAIVIFGGLIFFLIAGGGGSNAPSARAGPSDAEINANAQIQAAQIAAQASSANAAQEIALAQLSVSLKSEENKLNSELGRESIAAQMAMTNAQIAAQREIALAQAASNDRNAALNLAGDYIQAYSSAQIAAITNPIATTSTSQRGGFLGIGSKSSSTTTYRPQTVTMPDVSAIIASIGNLGGQPLGANQAVV